MSRRAFYLLCALVGGCLLISAGPIVVSVLRVAVPAVVAIGIAAAALRLVWYYTSRDR